MPQYNNQYSYETLQKLKLSMIPDTLDKREGSVLWNTISANSYALAIAFAQMGINQSNMYPDTASRKYLIRHCVQRGITPRPATYAKIKGEFFTSVITKTPFNPNIGTRFQVMNTDVIYTVTAQIGNGVFELTCETPGIIGNITYGTLVPIEEIQALGGASIVGIIDSGEDEEDTESLRERYMDSLKAQSFAGNKSAYRETCLAIDNVGACKVYRAYEGRAGHVGLCILDSELGVPESDLIAKVQEVVDPTQDGEGLGTAPIDHICHVFAATELPIGITLEVSVVNDTTWENLVPSIESAISDYFKDLIKSWDTTDSLIIRSSQITARLLDIPNILDVSQCQINGSNANLQLESSQIPKIGDISGAIS